MIELTLERLLNSVDSLKQLSTKTLKARTAFTVAKIIKEADLEVNNFNEIRVNLIDKYGARKENGELDTDENNNVKISQTNIALFNEELNDLLSTNLVLNANKILMEDLDNLEFTPAEILTLEPFIDSGE